MKCDSSIHYDTDSLIVEFIGQQTIGIIIRDISFEIKVLTVLLDLEPSVQDNILYGLLPIIAIVS